MALQDKLPTSILGLKGQRPATFDFNPAAVIHNTYSVNGVPNVRWAVPSNHVTSMQPSSLLDELDVNAPKNTRAGAMGSVVSQIYKSQAGLKYKDLGPVEGRY